MPTFTVVRDGSTIEDAVYDVSPLTDTANPFGDYAVIKLDDRGGDKFAEYSRGTRIDVEIDPDDTSLSIQSGETVTTDSGETDTYAEVRNTGTYVNAGTVTADGDTLRRFTGYVVERREIEEQGADALEVEAYSFDQFLRRNTVSNDQQGRTIAEALEDIITTDTPVDFVASNVEVTDEQELTRSYRGDPVEQVLRDFAFKSGNEAFGVNDELEFFFRPRESRHIDRGIDETQWFNYDIPELGKETINEVEVWFSDGDESVVVDDGTDKLDLQESLELSDPGTQRAELQRPLITDISDAEDVGRKYLKFRSSTLSGTITTFDLYDAEPGDTIDVTIPSRGIDTEFSIAAVRYRWARDETELTIVERRGDVDDILTDLSESVKRQELEGANRDAPKNRITTTNARALVDVNVTAAVSGPNSLTVASGDTLTVASGDTETADTVTNAGTVANAGTVTSEDSDTTVTAADTRFVNDGRRAVRDTWTGDAPPDISTLVVGTDGTGLSRSNTSLRNQTDSDPVTQSLPSATSVTFTGDSGETGAREVGVETAGGTLVARAVFGGTVDLAGDVDVTLSVANDTSVSRGVLTAGGQTGVRDALADNAPALPDEYAYGDGDAPVAESDTTLASEVTRVGLQEIEIQSADTTSEFQQLTTFGASDPFVVKNGQLELAQTAFVQEGETDNFGARLRAKSIYSDGEATFIPGGDAGATGDTSTLTFTPEYDIPSDAVGFQARIEPVDGGSDGTSNTGEFEVRLEESGTTLDTLFTEQENTNDLTIRWDYEFDVNYGGPDLSARTAYDLVIEITDGSQGDAGDELRVDVFAVYDDRFSYTFDNDNGGNDGYLDGPQLHPKQETTALVTATTRQPVSGAQFDSDWSDVSGGQFVELANDGTNFTRVNNSETGSVDFASAEEDVDTTLSFARYGSRTTETPQTGFLGQAISRWNLFADVEAISPDDIGETVARGIVAPNTITGETISEAGVFGDGTLLTRHVLAEFDVLADQRVASSETTAFTGDES